MRAFIICLLIVAAAAAGATSAPATPKERAQEYYSQGYLYYLEGSYTLAVPEFIKALKLVPSMSKARYWIAKSEYKLGNYRSVINQCDAALKTDPKNKDIASLRKLAEKKLVTEEPRKTTKTAKTTLKAPAPLTTNPACTEAVSAAPKSPEPVKKIEVVRTSPTKESVRTVSLDLRNVEISTVLQVFSKETGISVIAGRDVYGKVTVLLKNVPVDEALDIILKSNGFTYTRSGNIVQVFSSGEPARVEELPVPAALRAPLGQVGAATAELLDATAALLYDEDVAAGVRRYGDK